MSLSHWGMHSSDNVPEVEVSFFWLIRAFNHYPFDVQVLFGQRG